MAATNEGATKNYQEETMVNFTNGVGHFTARNIAAILKALPETNGTYQEVDRQASDYGVNVSPVTPGPPGAASCGPASGGACAASSWNTV